MDLELVPTDDLARELVGRFAHAVFVGMKVREAADREDCDALEYMHWDGEHRTAQGLLVAASDLIGRERQGLKKPDDGLW